MLHLFNIYQFNQTSDFQLIVQTLVNSAFLNPALNLIYTGTNFAKTNTNNGRLLIQTDHTNYGRKGGDDINNRCCREKIKYVQILQNIYKTALELLSKGGIKC
jgi:hypothetical protein